MKNPYFLWIKIKIYLLLLLLILVYPTTAQADILVLKDGRRIEGKIVESNPSTIVVLVKVGTSSAKIYLERKMILRIHKQKKTSWEQILEEYEYRLKSAQKSQKPQEWEALAKWCQREKLHNKAQMALQKALKLYENNTQKQNNTNSWLEFAKWCVQNKFFKKAEQAYQKVISLDPENATARNYLGYVRYKNKWYRAEEIEKIRDKEMRLKGYLKYKGKWYTPKALNTLLQLEKNKKWEEKLKLLQQKNDHLSQLLQQSQIKISNLEQKLQTLEQNYLHLLQKFKSLWLSLYQKMQEQDKKILELQKSLYK
ncbi:MAG: hypothetical protein D6805_02825 [Planctomycetota bacterium]|nr:MAG: hypothetical protein D6805_02825 [Planctomycetota bacterium]